MIIENIEKKIILSLFGESREEILLNAKELTKTSVEIIEWRLDYYKDFEDINKVCELAKILKKILNKKIFLITLRSQSQGGRAKYDQIFFKKFVENISNKNFLDIIDVEYSMPKDFKNEILSIIHDKGLPALSSYHDFEKTPDTNFMLEILTNMDTSGFDILKLVTRAVNFEDSLKILNVCNTYREKTQKKLILMAMGDFGKVTRIANLLFGSDYTFSFISENLADGQIPYKKMLRIYDEIL